MGNTRRLFVVNNHLALLKLERRALWSGLYMNVLV